MKNVRKETEEMAMRAQKATADAAHFENTIAKEYHKEVETLRAKNEKLEKLLAVRDTLQESAIRNADSINKNQATQITALEKQNTTLRDIAQKYQDVHRRYKLVIPFLATTLRQSSVPNIQST